MDLHLDRFRTFLDEWAKPRWEKFLADDWANLRPGGGEIYLQDKVLNKAKKFLDHKLFMASPRFNLLKALSSHGNLL